ncbi:MAG: NifB/NifX family molybdenum-iron cluster-binding protein [Bacteroidales bacterium]
MKYKVAIPVSNNCLCQHFGHCENFAVLETENNNILNEIYFKPPPHEPGVLPAWLASLGVTHILAGGMGQRAISLFNGQNIKVITGVQENPARQIVEDFLNNNLESGVNTCDH